MKTQKNSLLLISILKNSHRNLSCISLFVYLRAKGMDVYLLFIPREQEYCSRLLVDFLISHVFSLIGISVMTDNFEFAKTITNDLRELTPDAHICWGGVHPTLLPEECLAYADSVCVGEGEIALYSLAQQIDRKETYFNIPGIGCKVNGKIIVNPPVSLIENLDSLPVIFYDWERFYIQDSSGLRKFTNSEYTLYSNYNGEDYTIMTSRGCPFSCTYCCNSYINKLYQTRGKIRRRGVRHVIEEIRMAIKTVNNIQFINFNDDQFITDKEWNKEFCSAYMKEIGLPFIVRLCPGTFDEADLQLLKCAGLMFVTMGIQSGSDRTNKEIFKRRFSRSSIIQTSNLLSKNQIYPYYDVIIRNELEDDSDRKKTIELLLELEQPFALNFFSLTPFPRTELEQIYKKRSVVPKSSPYGSKSYSNYDESDSFFQLAYIIPSTTKNICCFFLENIDSGHVRRTLDEYYHWIKDTNNKITLSQLTIQSNPKNHHDLKMKRQTA